MTSRRRRKALRKPRRRERRQLRVFGVTLLEEPMLSPRLRLEKDTFSGGYNNTIRERNERRKAERHKNYDKLIHVKAQPAPFPFPFPGGFATPEQILVPSHLWDRVVGEVKAWADKPRPRPADSVLVDARLPRLSIKEMDDLHRSMREQVEEMRKRQIEETWQRPMTLCVLALRQRDGK